MKLLTELAALHKLFYIIARIWANCRDADTRPEYRFIQIADFIVISLDFKGRNRPGHHTRAIYKNGQISCHYKCLFASDDVTYRYD